MYGDDRRSVVPGAWDFSSKTWKTVAFSIKQPGIA